MREKCSFIFLPEKLLNCIFPSGVKKQELKIVCDTDTLRDKKSSCFYPVADYPNLVNKKETCSQKKKKKKKLKSESSYSGKVEIPEELAEFLKKSKALRFSFFS